MSEKLKGLPSHALRSLADLGQIREQVHARQPFATWDPGAKVAVTIGEATETLANWLQARFTDLVREKVPVEEVSIVSGGNRTQVLVRGQARFEFKIKMSMELSR